MISSKIIERYQISCCIAVRIAWYLMLTWWNNMYIALYAPLNAVSVYIFLQVLSSDFFKCISIKIKTKDSGEISFPVCVHIHRSIFSTSVQLWKHADLVLSLHSRSVKSVQFTSELLRISINDTSGSPSLVPKYLLKSRLLGLHPRLNPGCQSWGAVIWIFDKPQMTLTQVIPKPYFEIKELA